MGCVYRLVNTVNDTVYIGMTTKTAEKRFKRHVTEAKRDINRPICHAISKYGADSFDIEILFESEDTTELFGKEIELIALHKSFGARLYNATNGGEGIPGFSHNDETKEKSRQRLKAQWESPEFAEAIKQSVSKNVRAQWKDPTFRSGVSTIKLTDEDVLSIVKYCESGAKKADIAASFGIGISTVSQIMSGNQWSCVTGRPKTKPSDLFPKFTADQIEDMKTRHTAGESFTSIAKTYNTSHGIVSSRIRGH